MCLSVGQGAAFKHIITLFIFETMVLVELAYKSYLLVMLVQAEIDPLPNLAV